MSASRPEQLQLTSQALFDHIKYSGQIEYHLIESVLVDELSEQCIKYAQSLGYIIHKIRPAPGQGFAMDYAIKNILNDVEYALKMEDDFMPVVDLPLNECIGLMGKYKHINQICFNKRPTMKYKRMSAWNEKTQKCEIFEWQKEQRYFEMDSKEYPLVVKDRWWFGASIWRMSFIRPLFKPYLNDTHNKLNDDVIMPLAGFVYGDESDGFRGRKQPTAKQIEENVGCYIWGKTKDPAMVEHTGREESIWYGKAQKKWREQGYEVLGENK